jgi:uncharacterized membrane protein YkvA (DUF1232 family)
MAILDAAKLWARSLKRDISALWIAARDPRVPWYAKATAGAVVAYALSPVDLIPDFVPVLGYLDDIILVPLGILLVVRLVPAELMAEFRAQAAQAGRRPRSMVGLAVIILIWLAVAIWLGTLFWTHLSR